MLKTSNPPEDNNLHPAAARGFAQVYGLHPMVATATLGADAMLFTGEVMTFGLLLTFSVLAGLILGYFAYKTQRKLYGDDHEMATAKALLIFLFTAIPSPLPILYVPAGVVGLVHNLRRR